MNETNRQKKIASLLQEDLAQELQNLLRESGQTGIIISVSKVHVTVDLSLAKVYVSIFPADKGKSFTKELNLVKSQIKHRISQLTRHQLRKMPDLVFYLDDSIEYIEQINKALKGTDNPITNPELLNKRKKS
ncbi:MAG: 30S ribosome-binding factor RbfA [Bacteroidetes bacterium]|jgi:ribosome-binding factor A|nr:30S ribosome-binding factor RbfA [Bacteroidota bacterium]